MNEILGELEEASAKRRKDQKTKAKQEKKQKKEKSADGKGVHVNVSVGGDVGETEPQAEKGKEQNDEKNPLQETVDKLAAQIEELKDKDLRRQAEFDNFRKRTEKEKAQQFDAGAAHVLEHILPVIDNFERGFAMVEEADKDDSFVDGMNKVYKQLMTELEKLGVTPIEAVGKEFDPNVHNAVMQTDTGEVASGFVAQEMQKGYLYHDTVLRFSMVAVQS